MARNGNAMAEQYLLPDTCGLEEPQSAVNPAFVEVLERAAEKLGDTEVGASGCGSCAYSEQAGLLSWVAQGDSVETMMAHYGHDDYESDRVAARVMQAADELDVPASWNGETSMCVCLGADDRYTNLDPGTLVETQGRRGRKGMVVNADAVNPDMDYEVRSEPEKSFGRGEVVARAETKEAAEQIARNRLDDASVGYAMKHGTSDGDNLVQMQGRSALTTRKTSDLTVLD